MEKVWTEKQKGGSLQNVPEKQRPTKYKNYPHPSTTTAPTGLGCIGSSQGGQWHPDVTTVGR